MSVFDTRRDELERHELMMGAVGGRLAVALDLLTIPSPWLAGTASTARAVDGLASRQWPSRSSSNRSGDAKALVQSVMEMDRR